MTRINRQKILSHMSYTIKELVGLLSKNRKTILYWIQCGLKTMPGGKHPILIWGADLIKFLKNKDSKKKFRLKRNEFPCFHCKVARRAKRGSIQTIGNKKIGVCYVCSGKMCRIFKCHRKDYNNLSPPTQTSLFGTNLNHQ